MHQDIFNDRNGFDVKRRAYVRKIDASLLDSEVSVTIAEEGRNYVD